MNESRQNYLDTLKEKAAKITGAVHATYIKARQPGGLLETREATLTREKQEKDARRQKIKDCLLGEIEKIGGVKSDDENEIFNNIFPANPEKIDTLGTIIGKNGLMVNSSA